MKVLQVRTLKCTVCLVLHLELSVTATTGCCYNSRTVPVQETEQKYTLLHLSQPDLHLPQLRRGQGPQSVHHRFFHIFRRENIRKRGPVDSLGKGPDVVCCHEHRYCAGAHNFRQAVRGRRPSPGNQPEGAVHEVFILVSRRRDVECVAECSVFGQKMLIVHLEAVQGDHDPFRLVVERNKAKPILAPVSRQVKTALQKKKRYFNWWWKGREDMGGGGGG